jgi:hypothetical protein
MCIPQVSIGYIPDELKEGVRVISCVFRGKDGGHNKEYKRHLIDMVSRNQEEWEDYVDEMINEMPRDSRIYCSVNKRSPRKSSKLLAHKLIDAMDMGGEHLEHFISHPLSEGISALMTPSSADDKLFLWDCDSKSVYAEVKEKLNDYLVAEIPTKNGFHFITRPFNPELVSLPETELKRDALYLIAWT